MVINNDTSNIDMYSSTNYQYEEIPYPLKVCVNSKCKNVSMTINIESLKTKLLCYIINRPNINTILLK